MVIIVFKQILIIVALCIPLPSDQHFIWIKAQCVMEIRDNDGNTTNIEKYVFLIDPAGDRTRDLREGDTFKTCVLTTQPRRSSYSRPSPLCRTWPVNMCALADVCNHTWIPECGKHMKTKEMRLFLDECDLYEYSCDIKKDYVIQKYSDCFIQQPGALCPTVPCPSVPPCKNHRYHRAGDHFIYPPTARRMLRTTPLRPPHPLPDHMLHGKRRYTPKPKIFSTKAIKKKPAPKITKKKCTKITKTRPLRTTISLPKQKTKAKENFVILRKEVFIKNGRKAVRIFKGLPTKQMTSDSDFLEK